MTVHLIESTITVDIEERGDRTIRSDRNQLDTVSYMSCTRVTGERGAKLNPSESRPAAPGGSTATTPVPSSRDH
jgi:hypothetical protein